MYEIDYDNNIFYIEIGDSNQFTLYDGDKNIITSMICISREYMIDRIVEIIRDYTVPDSDDIIRIVMKRLYDED